MRTLVVLRHALTKKNRAATDTGSHLSTAGVLSARALGASLPSFDYVAVGDQPRHLETALALGSAVDEQVSWPSGYVPGEVDHHDQWSWSQPFATYAALLTDGSGLQAAVADHLDHWRRVVERVSAGGAGLVISSGGSIEPVLVAAMPHADHASWGAALHQLEGAKLDWDGEGFTSVELLRRTHPTAAQHGSE